MAIAKASLQNMLNPEKEGNIVKQAHYGELVREMDGTEEHKEVKEEEQIVAAVEEV